MNRPPKIDAGVDKHDRDGKPCSICDRTHWPVPGPPACSGTDHTLTCFLHRVFVPEVPDWRQL